MLSIPSFGIRVLFLSVSLAFAWSAPSPVTAGEVLEVTGLAAGGSHTCALTDGTVQCWGKNSDGQLGNGTTTKSTTPVTVSGVSTATAVAGGGYHTCAWLADGTVQCWGGNGYGQLGDDTTTNANTPVTVKPFAVPATNP